MHLSFWDETILAAYFVAVLGTGWHLRRRVRDSNDFLTTGRALPLWVTGIAFMAANLGSLEVLGMVASGAKYGMLTNHFYWIGAIPPMVFLGVFMMPFYYRSGVRSVPEYLKARFDSRSHVLNSLTFLCMTLLMSGINMFALATVFRAMLGWTFLCSVLVSAGVVVVYTTLGGLSSSIYNEVIQFFLIVAGFAPLSVFAFRAAGGWSGLRATLPASMLHTWANTGSAASNAFGANWFAISFGLGFVMSFGYWCTDFLLIQRALAARTLADARRTPLVAAVPKCLFPALVTLPGLCAASLLGPGLRGNYNAALPLLMTRLYGPGLLGLGLTALMASFMSGMAGNITAFNTVWTYDLYQTYMAPGRNDRHYLRIARAATVAGALASIGTAYIVLRFDNLMDYMQLIASFFISPLFATFLLGMFWRRTSSTGAFYGMLAGIGGSAAHYMLYRAGVLHSPTEMAATFYGAMYGWTASMLVTVVVSLGVPDAERELGVLVYRREGRGATGSNENLAMRWTSSVGVQGICILAFVVLLNFYFW